jgi:transposase
LQFNDSTIADPLRVRKGPLAFIPVESSNDADGSTIPVDVPPAEGEIFARAHSSGQGYSENAPLWGMRCSPEKRSSLLCRQHRHFSALLTRKFNSQRGIIEEQPEILGISDRHMRRWRERYVEEGYNGLLDRRRGKPSRRRVPVATVEKVFALYREKYFDLNVQHFHEKLQAEHGIELSYTWVKQALQGAGLVARGRRRGAHRKRRERRPLPGMLLHIDGSRHQWFQDERWYDLIVILDDATSEIYYAQLVEEESTATVMAGLREVIERKGVFCALYSDRGSHFWLTPKVGGSEMISFQFFTHGDFKVVTGREVLESTTGLFVLLLLILLLICVVPVKVSVLKELFGRRQL